MMSTWGSSDPISILKGSGAEAASATSAAERLVQFLMVPAVQGM